MDHPVFSPDYGFGLERSSGEFSFGIEEEYFLVESGSGHIRSEVPARLFETAHAATDGRVGREMLQSQVEVATPPSCSVAETRTEMRYIRRVLQALAGEQGLSILASGTHPSAKWQRQVQSVKPRYDLVMDSLQMIGQRNMLCGMHVHVELPDPDRRVDLMRRMLPYVPLLLALSTSSPFWQSKPTGLKGYRLAAYDELPRTGIPDLFHDLDQYDSYIDNLVRSGAIPNASHIWWTIRPSEKYPTLELRAPDSCTRIEDALAIASLYRVLVRHLFLNPQRNCHLDVVGRAMVVENKWRAQRYGTAATFVSEDGPQPVRSFLDDVIAMTSDDAEALDCRREVEHCRLILDEGSSADAQLRVYEGAIARGSNDEEALYQVMQWIIEKTTALDG